MLKNYRIGVYEKAFPEQLTIGEMLVLAKEAGYDYFEISIDRTAERIARIYDKEYMRCLRNVINETGINISSICLSALGTYTLGNPDEVICAKGMDIFDHALRFAEYIGAGIIQISACDVPKGSPSTDETKEKYIANLHIMAEKAAEYGVLIGLENMETEYMQSVKKCMTLIDEVKSPYFQLYPDSGNIMSAALLENNDIKADMYSGKHHYIAFHLKETRPNKYGGLFYGEGHVDFDSIIPIAWDLGVRMFVMEYWYTGNPEWKNDLVKARTFCINKIPEENR